MSTHQISMHSTLILEIKIVIAKENSYCKHKIYSVLTLKNQNAQQNIHESHGLALILERSYRF